MALGSKKFDVGTPPATSVFPRRRIARLVTHQANDSATIANKLPATIPPMANFESEWPPPPPPPLEEPLEVAVGEDTAVAESLRALPSCSAGFVTGAIPALEGVHEYNPQP